MENTLLKKQQESLVSEKADLVKKHELAKTEIQSILNRIKNMEVSWYGTWRSNSRSTWWRI